MQRIAKLEPEYITPPSSYLTFPSPPIILSHFFITSSQAACRFSSHSYVRFTFAGPPATTLQLGTPLLTTLPVAMVA